MDQETIDNIYSLKIDKDLVDVGHSVYVIYKDGKLLINFSGSLIKDLQELHNIDIGYELAHAAWYEDNSIDVSKLATFIKENIPELEDEKKKTI